MAEILVPISCGELVDKITILQIKQVRLTSEAQLANVAAELTALQQRWDAIPGSGSAEARALTGDLTRINTALWEIEDDIRDCERRQDFGSEFIRLARAVYVTNDERAAVKRKVNTLLKSTLFEEKSYKTYTAQ